MLLVQVNDGGVDEFAGVVHDGTFDAVAVAGVEAEGGEAPCGGGEEQVFEVGSEDGDGVVVGVFFEAVERVEFEAEVDFGAPSEADGVEQPAVRADVVVRGDGFFVVAGFGGGDVVRAVFEGELQDAVVPAAQYGQRAVAGHGADGFAVVVVVAVFFAFVCLVGVALGVQFAFAPEFFAQGADEFGVFRDLFDEDGARAVQRGFGVGDVVVGVSGGEGFDVLRLVGEEGL